MNTTSSDPSRNGFSQPCFQSFTRAIIGYSAKFIDPMFRLHISGALALGAASRWSSVITADPPVVMFTMPPQPALITGKNRAQSAGSAEGCPVKGLRACRCKIAAPACAASIACAAISSAVTGR